MMCYPSIDSLIKKVDSKYRLVTLSGGSESQRTYRRTACIDSKCS